MLAPIDEATEQFLDTAAKDLQRQINIAGVVERVSVMGEDGNVWLVAKLVVGRRTLEVTGFGRSLVDAYAELRVRVAEPTLIAAYLELVDYLEPVGPG